jgi:hypothetical protein
MAALAAAGLVGCVAGSGQPLEEDRAVGQFTAIRTEGPVDIELSTAASSSSVSVRCDDNLLDSLSTTVESGVLVVGFERAVAPRTTCRLRTGRFLLASLSSTGAGALRGEGPLAPLQSVSATGSGAVELRFEAGATSPATPELELTRGGTGDMRLVGLDLGSLRLDHRGAGDVELTGLAGGVELESTGAGWVDAAALPASEGVLRHGGAGRMTATITDSVVVENTGPGDVVVLGQPAEQDLSATGAGRVILP